MNSPGIITRWKTSAPYFLSILRIMTAFTFVLFGTSKLFAFPEGIPPNGGTVKLLTQAGLAGVLEAFGGGLLLLGLFTRPIAFLLAGEMAVAYFQAHAPNSIWPTVNHGVSAYMYCFVWLYISSAGAGPWSLDAIFKKRHTLPTQ